MFSSTDWYTSLEREQIYSKPYSHFTLKADTLVFSLYFCKFLTRIMYKKFPSIYHRMKASVLLLCLGFMLVGTCPIQKILLSNSPVKAEASTQATMSKAGVKNQLTCSYGEEVIKAPLVDLTKKSNNNPLYFILLSTIAYLFTSFLSNRSISIVNRRFSLVSPVPLFLRNQVFRI